MTRRYLRQKTSGEIFVWTAEMAQREDMEEFIKALPRQNDLTFASEIPRIESDVIRLYLSARGLGDAITGLYAACGLADAGHEVEFYTQKVEWLYVNHPGVKILKGEDGFDANANYRGQMAECRTNGMTRADWYLANIAKAYGIKKAKAARPKEIHLFPKPLDGQYVLLCPFSMSGPRSWLPAHYRRLAILLQKQGVQVAAIADQIHRKRCEEIFYGLGMKLFLGQKPEVVCALVQHAECVVGNDSGPAHLGGLYAKKTIVLTAQFKPEYVFDGANNLQGMAPNAPCVFCHEQDAGGFDQFCIDSCSALQLISPEVVAKEITNVTKEVTTADMAAVVFNKRKSSGKTNQKVGDGLQQTAADSQPSEEVARSESVRERKGEGDPIWTAGRSGISEERGRVRGLQKPQGILQGSAR